LSLGGARLRGFGFEAWGALGFEDLAWRVPGFENLSLEVFEGVRLRRCGPTSPRQSLPQNHRFLLLFYNKNDTFSIGMGGTIGEVRTGPWEDARL